MPARPRPQHGRRTRRREIKEAEMSRIVVMNHVTLDGVMQAPGRPDEDTRGGFSKAAGATVRQA